MPTSYRIWVSSGLFALVPRSMDRSGPDYRWFLLVLSLTMLDSKTFLFVEEVLRTWLALYRLRWFTVGTFYLMALTGNFDSSSMRLFILIMRWSSSSCFLLRSLRRALAACWADVAPVVAEAVVVNPESPISPEGILWIEGRLET
jgi:hypothetical protein